MALFILLDNFFLVDKASSLIATLFKLFALLVLVLFSAILVFVEGYIFEDSSALLLFDVIFFAILRVIRFTLSGSTKTSKKTLGIFINLSICDVFDR